MRKGKHQFNLHSEEPEDFEFFDPEVSEEEMLARTTRGRPRLTERDTRRNAGVKQLLSNITPGLPINADPLETSCEPSSFSSLIKCAMRDLDAPHLSLLEEIRQAWPRLLPRQITDIAYPGRFANGILFVYAENSVRLHELRRFHMRDIKEAVRQFEGADKVRQIKLQVGAHD